MGQETAEPLMAIGAFAERSRLSLKALRLYERQGLLIPCHVDPDTGYRWYHRQQLFTARLIVLLRGLDMPLARIAEVVDTSGADSAELVAAHWEAVERRVAAQRELVERLVTGLRAGDERFGRFEIEERDVPDQLVLRERRHVELAELDAWREATHRRLAAEAERYGGPVAGAFVIYHGRVNLDSNGPVEMCLPIRRDQEPADADVRYEPAHREAYIRVTRGQFEVPHILSVYDAVAAWIDARGVARAGSPREVHLPGVDPATAAPADHVCDVAFPIR